MICKALFMPALLVAVNSLGLHGHCSVSACTHPQACMSSCACEGLKRETGSIAEQDALCAGQGPAAGPYAQGWGPLRVWPGGLCLSRALGDFDVGSLVLAIPHIMQVRPSLSLGLYLYM